MKRQLVGLLLSATLLFAAGCSLARDKEATPPGAQPVPTQPGSGQQAPAEEAVEFVQLQEPQWPDDVKQWVVANRQNAGQHMQTFGDYTYLLIALGEKPSGGYAVQVTGVRRAGGKLVVDAVQTAPNGPAITVLTYPVGVVRIAKSSKDFEVKWGSATARDLPATPIKTGTVKIDQAAMQKLQESVDQGHQPWRLDPFQVAMDEGRQYGFAPDAGDKFTLVSKGSGEALVTAEHQGKTYQIKLIQPTGSGPGKIWTIAAVTEAP